MGERKVINKYYPPDFDPAKLTRARKPKNGQIKSRMMLPMTIRCNTCSHFIYKGTKFNSRMEEVIGETYLGIKVFRFYFKCTNCLAELTIKTDPQNSDYIVESSCATRNFEPWRRADEGDQEADMDTMKSLENRASESKREMDIDAQLEEIKSMKSRRAKMSVDTILKVALQRKESVVELVEEDEALIKSIVFSNSSSRDFVRRIVDDTDGDLYQPNSSCSTGEAKFKRLRDHGNNGDKLGFGGRSVQIKSRKLEETNATATGLHSLFQNYGSLQ